MKYWASVLAIALISSVLFLAFFIAKKENINAILENASKNTVIIKLPKMYLWVGVICCALMLSFLVITVCVQYEWWAGAVFGSFALLSAFLIHAQLRWRIVVEKDSDEFEYRPIFGKAFTVKYTDCIGYQYKRNQNVWYVYTNSKKIYLDSFAINAAYFMGMLGEYKIKELK